MRGTLSPPPPRDARATAALARTRFGRIAREPLVHFVVLGGLLFGVHAFITRHDDRRIFVTGAVRSEIARELADRLGRSPRPDEIAAAVERWKEDEVLYREGLRRGLDREDPVVRSRIAAKLRELAAAVHVSPAPTQAELDAWRASHGSWYAGLGASIDGGVALPVELRDRLVRDVQDADRAKAERAFVDRLLREYQFVETP